ncbi:archease [Allorhizocola rhizosphaerae]|uniref:archease n=1 Tax=Allorhizocola rhizosphaerae TaxID=1872709 RepID=UPI000E3CF35D|nr:archease [Allorhizocola rhizosphaerae]
MSTESGHRLEPHTADTRVRAWAPTREQCIAEAVAALVESFAQLRPGGEPGEPAEFDVLPGPPDELLIAVLDEIIYLIDTTGKVPSSAQVMADDGGLRVLLELAGRDRIEVIGPVPKAVTLHGLEFSGDERGWSCRVILDV